MYDEIFIDFSIIQDYNICCDKCLHLSQPLLQTKSLDSVAESFFLFQKGSEIRLEFIKFSELSNYSDRFKTFTTICVDHNWPHQWISVHQNCYNCGNYYEYKIKFTDGVMQDIIPTKLVRSRI